LIHSETAAKINFLRTSEFYKLQEKIPRDQIEVKYGGTYPNQTLYWYSEKIFINLGQ